MTVSAIKITEPKQKKAPLLQAGMMGAAMGAGARYLLPTKSELGSIFNKQNFDTFVSSSAIKSRGANRSILGYAALGAFILGGVSLILNKFKNHRPQPETVEYTKLGALMDASPFACEVLWYDSDKLN